MGDGGLVGRPYLEQLRPDAPELRPDANPPPKLPGIMQGYLDLQQYFSSSRSI